MVKLEIKYLKLLNKYLQPTLNWLWLKILTFFKQEFISIIRLVNSLFVLTV